MSSFTSFALLALSAAGSLAAPSQKRTNDDYNNCLTFAQANQVATNYGQLIANYSKDLADKALSPNFTDYSESVNTLINECPQGSAAITLPLLSPTFTSREQFELGQGQQAAINFQQLNIWPACNTVVIRWQTTNTANITNVKPVNGIIVMETVPAPAGNEFPFVIDTLYSEFDAGAWLQNLKDAGICAAVSTSSSVVPPTPSTTSAPVTTPTPGTPNPNVVVVTDYTSTTDVSYATTTVWV